MGIFAVEKRRETDRDELRVNKQKRNNKSIKQTNIREMYDEEDQV